MQPISPPVKTEEKKEEPLDNLVEVFFSMPPYRTIENEQERIKKLQEDLDMARRVTDISTLLASLSEKK